MWTNKLKQKLAAGETAYGPFLRMPGPSGVELAAQAGFDFVLIDLEHSSLSLSDTEAMIVAGTAAEITPLVRVPEVSGQAIHRVLDIGAYGIMVPQVGTEAEARTVSNAAKFAPIGRRGMAGPTRANGWGEFSAAEGMARVNRETLCIAQIESEEGLANLEFIAKQPGIDMLFVGPLDLSQALGVPGQPDHNKVVEATLRVISMAQRHGKYTGIYAGTAEQAAFWKVHGVNLIAAGLDTVILAQAFRRVMAGLRPG